MQTLAGAGSAAGSAAGGAVLVSGIGCGLGALISAAGTTAGTNEYQEGIAKLTTEYTQEQGDRVAASFDPNTHPGELSRVDELGRAAVVAAAELAVGRLGLRFSKKKLSVDELAQGKGCVSSNCETFSKINTEPPAQKLQLQSGLTGQDFHFFDNDEMSSHFAKHGSNVMSAIGKTEYNIKEYLQDANHVIREGVFVSELHGYVKMLGGVGSAKYAFVGLDRASGKITTFHIKSVRELMKKAPSLGLVK